MGSEWSGAPFIIMKALSMSPIYWQNLGKTLPVTMMNLPWTKKTHNPPWFSLLDLYYRMRGAGLGLPVTTGRGAGSNAICRLVRNVNLDARGVEECSDGIPVEACDGPNPPSGGRPRAIYIPWPKPRTATTIISRPPKPVGTRPPPCPRRHGRW